MDLRINRIKFGDTVNTLLLKLNSKKNDSVKRQRNDKTADVWLLWPFTHFYLI